MVQWSKSHNGPLNDPDEIDAIVKGFGEDENALRSALTHSIKFDNPLFGQNKIGTPTMIKNLMLLLMKTDIPIEAK